MLPRKRLLVAMAAAGSVALPAGVLAGLCLGKACDRTEPARGRVPFCSLPQELRSLIANGFRDGRSPHVLAIAGDEPISDPSGPWPSVQDVTPRPVPLAFAGPGLSAGAEVPAGTTLDAIAPTIAEMMQLNRRHPGVRSGQAISRITSSEKPRLVVLVAWKGVGSRELERQPQRWPVLRGLIEDGAGTMEALTGALPSDPAATLTTIGTGALPRDHGITGSLVRNDQGEAAAPWSENAPFSVVATLGDDLDEIEDQTPLIGLVAADQKDLGLIGGNWYLEHDRDDLVLERTPTGMASATEGLLASGYGADTAPDLLAVAMEGTVTDMDEALGRILVAAEDASKGSYVLAVTSTGSTRSNGSGGPSASHLEQEVQARLGTDVIEGTTPGGLFIDQEAMTESGLSDDRVVSALRAVKTADGDPALADVFPALAVTFARYC